MALLVRRATYLLRDARRIGRDVDLLVQGNRIVAIDADLPVPPDAETIDAQGCAVIPGLVNAHTHLYQNFLKGAGAGLRLVPWCNAVIFPMVDVILQEQHAGNQRLAYLWSVLGALEMIRAGTTCCQDLDVTPYLSLTGVLEAWRDVGLRGVGAITLANRWVPPHLLFDEQEARRSAERLIEQEHKPDGRVQVALGPSTPFLCDEGLLRWVRDTAEARDLGIHTHVGETVGEVEDALREWGKRPVERLGSLGLLGERLSAAHCIHVDQVEIELLARTDKRLLITATEIETGQLCIFDNKDVLLTPDHILASCSIPLVYPWTKVGDCHYWDGAVMANTPLAGAIDAGADEILVVLLSPVGERRIEPPRWPWQAFAVMLDLALSATFENDFKQLESVNRLVMAQLDEKHRHVRCQVITPSQETGLLRIIRYEPEASRELIDLGYADARRALAEKGQQPAV